MQNQPTEIVFIIAIGAIIALFLVGFIITTLFLYQQRQRKQEEQIKDINEQFIKELNNAKLETHEYTLKQIGVELHDNIKHELQLIAVDLERANKQHPTELEDIIFNSKKSVHNLIKEVANMSDNFVTDSIQFNGFLDTVANEVAKVNRLKRIEIVYECDVYSNYFNHQASTFLYRMLQECLQNIIKHANASTVFLRLYTENEDQFVMQIEDNGKGFDVEQKLMLHKLPNTNERVSIGLKNMYKRVALIGGNIVIESALGKGTCVTIKVPIPNEEE
ncbi:MAG: sensor histidine kinase [Chitinophagaceae bacterium]